MCDLPSCATTDGETVPICMKNNHHACVPCFNQFIGKALENEMLTLKTTPYYAYLDCPVCGDVSLGYTIGCAKLYKKEYRARTYSPDDQFHM